MVLALVERERKVSFHEALHALQSNGVGIYVVLCMKMTKGDKNSKVRVARLTCFKGY
jgi:hypothetical protein